jgi:hypothetical protein
VSRTLGEGSEKVQNCSFYVGAQFIEPDDNGFDKSNPYKRKRYFFRELWGTFLSKMILKII